MMGGGRVCQRLGPTGMWVLSGTLALLLGVFSLLSIRGKKVEANRTSNKVSGS